MALSPLIRHPELHERGETLLPVRASGAPLLQIMPPIDFAEAFAPAEALPEAVVSDDELVAALAAGEEAALGALYDRHGHVVFGLLVRIVGDRSAAEDLLQDVFLRAWQQAHAFDEQRGTVRAWLHCIAHSLALNELRRRRRRPQVQMQSGTPKDGLDESDTYAGCVDPGPDPALDAYRAVRDTAVARALDQLPLPQRQVLRMYAAGFSQSEIATSLGEPLGTVKSRMRRGLCLLRASLATDGIDAI